MTEPSKSHKDLVADKLFTIELSDALRMHVEAVALMPHLDGRPSPWRKYWMHRFFGSELDELTERDAE